jgi:hypothetical protein
MKLDSARALKQELFSKVMTAAWTAGLVSSMAVAAGAMPNSREPQRLMSIGIAPATKRNVRLAVRVQRRALLGHPAMDKVRALAGNEVEVRYVGRIHKRVAPWYQRRRRPLEIGVSVGHFAITAGTLGCFVAKPGDAKAMILSNNHVLAAENQGKPGEAVLQQARYDGGRTSTHTVAQLGNFVRLQPTKANLVDAALATVTSSVAIVAGQIRGLGALSGAVAPPDAGDGKVAKLGRTTGLRRGRITAFELDDVVVAYDLGNLSFDNQIEIESMDSDAFSDGGDSGSLIVNDGMDGVGLLFAGSDQGGANGAGLTYANPLGVVLEKLGVALLT